MLQDKNLVAALQEATRQNAASILDNGQLRDSLRSVPKYASTLLMAPLSKLSVVQAEELAVVSAADERKPLLGLAPSP